MALSNITRLYLRLKDIFHVDFLRYLLKACWLFFPPIMFLGFAYGAFWYVVQGKDLMVITLEDLQGKKGSGMFIYFTLALFFWTYVTWYSTRLVAKAKEFQNKDEHNTWRVFREQVPRLLAFTCITIITLAFFQLDNPDYPYHLSRTQCNWWLLGSIVWYIIIYRFWKWILVKNSDNNEKWRRYLQRWRLAVLAGLVIWPVVVFQIKTFGALISLLLGWQFILVSLLMIRRELIELNKRTGRLVIPPLNIKGHLRFFKRFWYVASDKEDIMFFYIFCVISAVAFRFYIKSVFSYETADTIGSFPFILLAFGVLLGIGNLITFASAIARINFHLAFYLWAFAVGRIYEDSHFAKIINKQDTTAAFSSRMHLKDYFRQWINDPVRQQNIQAADSSNPYPVYFILANGGASRSGYWTASVLSELEDISKGKFSNHLFCLSGTSGGSVGNATFFNLLRLKKELGPKKLLTESRSFLSSDFLTYTLSHLLCTDIFRNIIPARRVKDRAAALAYALEKADSGNILFKSFESGFSTFMTQKNHPYHLPVLCINTTRLQKGTPGVISNISIQNDGFFNGRLDVLSLLSETKDMKLSTAVVLGASFPYISPAGRIDHNDTSYYFVDGGYFDNSGAGVVNEMMIEMVNLLQNDTAFSGYKKKIQFRVLHITNTDPKKMQTGKINPITNDLLAPVKTIMSSYGSQTTVNDQRLKNYLASLCKKKEEDICTHYTNIDLYTNAGYIVLKKEDTIQLKFSMNWVISDYQRRLMDSALVHNKDFQKTCEAIRQLNDK